MALAIAGCVTRTEYVRVEPECEVPPKPAELSEPIEHDLEDGRTLPPGTTVEAPDSGPQELQEPHRLLAPGEAYAPESLYWAIVDRDKALTDWALELRAALRPLCESQELSGK